MVFEEKMVQSPNIALIIMSGYNKKGINNGRMQKVNKTRKMGC